MRLTRRRRRQFGVIACAPCSVARSSIDLGCPDRCVLAAKKKAAISTGLGV